MTSDDNRNLEEQAADGPQTDSQKLERLRTYLHEGRKTPVTALLVVLNGAMFAAMVLSVGMSAFLMPDTDTVFKWGALSAPATLSGQYWRLLSAIFVHAGIVHIVINMYVLYFMGPLVERVFGSWRFLLIFLLAGIGGNINTLLWTPEAVAVGASGANLGIFGGFLAFLQAHASEFPQKLVKEKMVGLLAFLALSIGIGFFQPNIGNAAHIGGLAIGYLAAFAVMPRDPSDLRWHWRDSLRVATVVLALSFLVYLQKRGVFDFGGALSLAKGADMIVHGEYKQAIPLLDKRIQLMPDDTHAYAIRANAYMRLGQYDSAIEDCNKILSTDSKHLGALLTRAGSYARIGEYKKAQDDLDKAQTLLPKTAGAYSAMGENEFVAGNYKAALDFYTKALAMRPELGSPHNSLAYIEFALGDKAAAIEEDRKYLESAGWQDENADYGVIVAVLANRLSGNEQAAGKLLDEAEQRLDHKTWPFPVIEYLRGAIDAEKLQSQATDNDKMTEAKAYIGLQLITAGKKDEARSYFEWVIKNGRKDYYEYQLARVELAKTQ